MINRRETYTMYESEGDFSPSETMYCLFQPLSAPRNMARAACATPAFQRM